MTLAKVVRLQARPGQGAALDHALSEAQRAAALEIGTTAWEWFPGVEEHCRVIIELFADDEAAAQHDASPAVAALLARFAEMLATDPDVEVLRNMPAGQETRRKADREFR